jgi:hypothetical protein
VHVCAGSQALVAQGLLLFGFLSRSTGQFPLPSSPSVRLSVSLSLSVYLSIHLFIQVVVFSFLDVMTESPCLPEAAVAPDPPPDTSGPPAPGESEGDRVREGAENETE